MSQNFHLFFRRRIKRGNTQILATSSSTPSEGDKKSNKKHITEVVDSSDDDVSVHSKPLAKRSSRRTETASPTTEADVASGVNADELPLNLESGVKKSPYFAQVKSAPPLKSLGETSLANAQNTKRVVSLLFKL